MSFGDPLSSITPVLGDYDLYIGDVEPETPGTGDIWADTSTNQWKEWSGAAWVAWGFGMPAVVDPSAGQLVVLGAETGETVFTQKLVLDGCTQISVTDSMPVTQEPGVLYFVKP